MFVIPYEQDFSLIGTTDLDYRGDPGQACASAGEIEYLCRVASKYFLCSVTLDQVVWTFAGLRRLFDDRAADVVWRRSKLGLRMTPQKVVRVEAALADLEPECDEAAAGYPAKFSRSPASAHGRATSCPTPDSVM